MTTNVSDHLFILDRAIFKVVAFYDQLHCAMVTKFLLECFKYFRIALAYFILAYYQELKRSGTGLFSTIGMKQVAVDSFRNYVDLFGRDTIGYQGSGAPGAGNPDHIGCTGRLYNSHRNSSAFKHDPLDTQALKILLDVHAYQAYGHIRFGAGLCGRFNSRYVLKVQLFQFNTFQGTQGITEGGKVIAYA